MCCIENAQKSLNFYQKTLKLRGFDTHEAEYLSGIKVQVGNNLLVPYAIWDDGRIGDINHFRKHCPEALADLERQDFGNPGRITWRVSSTSVDLIPISPRCGLRVEKMKYVDARDSLWHIDNPGYKRQP